MARYTGPKCKLCRREGVKLFLKGSRCLSEKCAITKRNQPPGQHGANNRNRLSDYGKHLREKQKVKRIYGLLETQFRNYYEKAARIKGVTGDLLLQMLETRIDSVVYSAGFATSRAQARQMVSQGKVKINGKLVDIPSYQISINDKVDVEGAKTLPKEKEDMPEWLSWDSKSESINVKRLPVREDISAEINEQLIVEFYSR